MTTRQPEPPRKLSEAAEAYFKWLVNRLDGTDNWQPVDGTTLACLAELLESQEQLQDSLKAEPQNPTYLRLRLQYAAQIASYSRMVGLCPKHRQPNEPLRNIDLAAVAAELGLELDFVQSLTPGGSR